MLIRAWVLHGRLAWDGRGEAEGERGTPPSRTEGRGVRWLPVPGLQALVPPPRDQGGWCCVLNSV